MNLKRRTSFPLIRSKSLQFTAKEGRFLWTCINMSLPTAIYIECLQVICCRIVDTNIVMCAAREFLPTYLKDHKVGGGLVWSAVGSFVSAPVEKYFFLERDVWESSAAMETWMPSPRIPSLSASSSCTGRTPFVWSWTVRHFLNKRLACLLLPV